MNKLQKHRSLLPVVLLALLCQWTFRAVWTGRITLDPGLIGWGPFLQHIAGFIAPFVCLIFYFLYRKQYAWILLVTLVLGTFNVINFCPFESRAIVRFRFVLELGFQPLVALIAGIAAVQLIMTGKKAGVEDERILNAEAVADFKDRYHAYDTTRLEEIVRENRYVPEALEAAKQILQERVTTPVENV